MSELIKKQHYVPQHYLKSWTDKNKNIQTLLKLKNKIINTKLVGVCQERYFYKLNKLSQNEINNLQNFINDDLYKENILHKCYCNYFIIILNLLANNNELSINLFEKCLSKIEQKGYKLLQCKNINDFKNIYDLDVLFYIIIQLVRTNKVKQNIINDPYINNEKRQSYLNVLPILMFLVAFKFIDNLYNYHHIKFSFLINNTNISFITGDQPIINISKDKNNIYYYPLSPKFALLIHINDIKQPNNKDFEEIFVDENFIKEKNKNIFDNAYNFVFSSNENILKELNNDE